VTSARVVAAMAVPEEVKLTGEPLRLPELACTVLVPATAPRV